MQDSSRPERQRPSGEQGRFDSDGAGERGYRGTSPEDTPPGAVPGGSYGGGGGYSRGGYEQGNFDPAVAEYGARRRGFAGRPRQQERPRPRGRGGYAPEGLGIPSEEADFERGDWEGAGEWHGRARPDARYDADDYQDTGFGEARGGAFGGSAGYGRQRPEHGSMRGNTGWSGGFAPEGTWHGGYESAPHHQGDWRGTGEWGYRGGPQRGSDEWFRAGGDTPQRLGDPWDVPGPHTGRGPEGYRRSEEAIREEVCERLTRHGHLDASGISVRVEEGEVTLEGTVESRRAKRMAEDAVETVYGVRDVHNRLRVTAGERTAGERTAGD